MNIAYKIVAEIPIDKAENLIFSLVWTGKNFADANTAPPRFYATESQARADFERLRQIIAEQLKIKCFSFCLYEVELSD